MARSMGDWIQETAWLRAREVVKVFDHINSPHDSRHAYGLSRRIISQRKCLLIGVAFCRQTYRRGLYAACRAAVEATEDYADGLTSAEAVREIRGRLEETYDFFRDPSPEASIGYAAYLAAEPELGIHDLIDVAYNATFHQSVAAAVVARREGKLCDLVRDVTGNLFSPVQLQPAVCEGYGGKVCGRDTCSYCVANWPQRLAPGETVECDADAYRAADKAAYRRGMVVTRWLTPQVKALALAAYEGRDAEDGHIDPLNLAAVADAMEEAGCTSTECPACGGKGSIGTAGDYDQYVVGCSKCGDGTNEGSGVFAPPVVAHLRSSGPHVRGCWALDLILGRE